MKKETLQDIFSSAYNRDQWRDVLNQVFGATSLLKEPKRIHINKNKIADSAFELGSFETSDYRIIGLYEIHLNENPQIERNRIGLRELLRSIYKDEVDGALVTFVQGDKWRFSFISEIRILDDEGKIITQGTEPKRFTYLFGKSENTRTAAERFELLVGQQINLADLKEAFSVEKLSKDFFDDYKNVFMQFENEVAKSIPDSKANDKEAAERRRLFTQRLFNRLMFIYFLQKKGWLSFEGDRNYLRRLFSEAERNGENFYQERLRWLFFSGLGVNENFDLHESKILKERRGIVPYLNGGLFEKDNDGFDEPKAVKIKNSLFSELLEFFEKYNFTVDESTPIDIEIAVDPEMLGKVFEELVTGRHDTGSYYTPRQVVQFMCRESLKNYLAETEVSKTKIKELVEDYKVDYVSVDEARKLLLHLENVKVVDPACGSGAYLLGILQELKTITFLLDTRTEGTPLEIYDRKLKIIQNNIYGVDLDIFAVQIARLRLWLSLAVDFTGEIPQPLPNLDFKIEQGDSLTAPNPQQGNLIAAKDDIEKYKRAKADYFKASLEHPHDSEYKENLRQQIDTLHDDISFWVHSNRSANTPADAFDWAIEFAEVFMPNGEIDGGFDIVLANPPYGAKVADNVRDLYFDRRTEGSQSKDTYGLFMARGLQMLRPNGVLSYIISDTWRTIKSHKPLRQRFLNESTIKHFLDLPPWIFNATVNTCILTVSKQNAPEDHNVIAGDLRNLPNKNWQMLEENLKVVAAHGFDAQTLDYARYSYPQSLILTYNNFSFFIASPELYKLMGDERFTRLGTIADVPQGISTGQNKYYVRKLTQSGGYKTVDLDKVLSDEEIKNLTDEEKRLRGINPPKFGGKHFIPFDKGGASESDEGWMPNYFVPTESFIDWSENAVNRLKTLTIEQRKIEENKEDDINPGDDKKLAAALRNPDAWFKPAITYSPTGIYSPTFRMGTGTLFQNTGSGVVCETVEIEKLLGLLASTWSRYLFKGFLNHTVHTQEGDVVEFPLCDTNSDKCDEINENVNSIIEKQKLNLQYPYHLHEQKEIDKLVYELYGLSPEDIREVEIWYCRRYAKLAEAQGFTDEVRERHKDFLAHCDLLLSKPPSYWTSHPITKLIAEFENHKLDFKEFYGVNNSGVSDANSVRSTLKTIAAFLNSDGGTVLVGVDDSGNIKGIASDLGILHNPTRNEFELKIRNAIRDRFSPSPTGLIEITFHDLPEGTICRIDVQPTKTPTYFDNQLYVRNGNQTERKVGTELTTWIQERTLYI